MAVKTIWWLVAAVGVLGCHESAPASAPAGAAGEPSASASATPADPAMPESGDEADIRIIDKIHFGPGETSVRPASDPLLDKVAAILKAHPKITVDVVGRRHKKEPVSLALARAHSVLEALVKRGIDRSRLRATAPPEAVDLDPELARQVEFVRSDKPK